MLKRSELKSIIKRKKADLLILALALFLGHYMLWSIPQILLLGAFVWIIMNPVPSKLPALLAIISLLSVVCLLVVFNNKFSADRVAIYAYFFLVMTVFMGIYELKNEKTE